MDIFNGFGLALPLAIGIAALGGGFGLGAAVKGAMDAIGRQPEASGKLFLPFIIGCALIEALTIYALVAFFAGPGIAQQVIQAAGTAGH
jgi:F-type H+-transporting ATPase subunit c